MLHTLKTVLTNPPIASFPRSLSCKRARKISVVRFCSTQPDSDHSSDQRMDKKQNLGEEEAAAAHQGDVMSHSFGEGYATRSDEEGFGGIYGGNQSTLKSQTEIHENHPAYDKTQGSEVKEKEKGRHQPSANA